MTRQKMSRTQKITNHLLRGHTITGRQALYRFGVYRLSALIFNLRKKGFVIETIMNGRNNVKYATYKLQATPSA